MRTNISDTKISLHRVALKLKEVKIKEEKHVNPLSCLNLQMKGIEWTHQFESARKIWPLLNCSPELLAKIRQSSRLRLLALAKFLQLLLSSNFR